MFYSGEKGMILLQGLARAITCGTRALLMENKSAQNRREFKREYFVLTAAFQREPFYLSNLPSGRDFFWTPDERRPCTLRKGDWIVSI